MLVHPALRHITSLPGALVRNNICPRPMSRKVPQINRLLLTASKESERSNSIAVPAYLVGILHCGSVMNNTCEPLEAYNGPLEQAPASRLSSDISTDSPPLSYHPQAGETLELPDQQHQRTRDRQWRVLSLLGKLGGDSAAAHGHLKPALTCGRGLP